MNNEFVMTRFWQQPDGTNCAVTAMIKVAIIQFGVGKVFKTVKKGNVFYQATKRAIGAHKPG